MAKWPKKLPEMPDKHKLIFDLTSDEYHGVSGTYSSSQFKDLLDDEEIFIKKYIEKVIPKEDIPAFGTGNYFHTGVLEPHNLKRDCVVYDSGIRRGAKWDAFAEKNRGKVIITSSQKDQAERLIAAVQGSPIAMDYIKNGRAEVSLFNDIWVKDGEIFSPEYNKMLDLEAGWLDFEVKEKDFKTAVKLVLKVRADSLGEDFVLDLKSTTGNARSNFAMRGKISYYLYQLSAALYLDMFSLEKGEQIDTFIWTFASKDCHNCKSYKASRDNLFVGRAMWMKAVRSLAVLMKNDFQLYDELGVLEPQSHELEIIRKTDSSLL
jgi:hypothetical protein